MVALAPADRRKAPRTIATSKSPIWFPSGPTPAQIETIDRWLPALPAERRARLAAVVGGASAAVAVATAVDRDLDDLAIRAIEAGGDAARVLTHVDNDLAVEGAQDLDPERLAELTRMEVAGELTATQAKQVLADMVDTGREPARDRCRSRIRGDGFRCRR